MKQNKFYNIKWFEDAGYESVDDTGYNTWEKAGDAEEVCDKLLSLIREYRDKHGKEAMETMIERFEQHELANGFHYVR